MNTDDLFRSMVAVARCRALPDVLRTVARTLAACDSVVLVVVWIREAAAGIDEPARYRPGVSAGPAAGQSTEASWARRVREAWAGRAGRDGATPWPDAAFVEREQVQTVFVRPLMHGANELGLLALLDRAAFSPPLQAQLDLVADHAAAAIANAQAAEETEARLHGLADENASLREEFRDLFEEAPIPYVHEGLDSRFIRANRAAMKVLGLAPEEVTDTLGTSLLAENDETRDRVREAFAGLGAGAETRDVVLQLRRKDNGQPVWVRWWSRPAPDGQSTRSMLVDVTEHVLIERTKQALQFSLESGQVGDWDLDLVNQTSRRSLRHDQCFGYDRPIPEAEWGVPQFLGHVHADDRRRVQDGMRQAVERREDWAEEFRVIWPDGSLHWLVARGRLYHLDGREATRMLGIVMDVTDRKKIEESLRETRAALDFALESAEIGDWDLDLVHDTSRRSMRHDRCFGYDKPVPESEWGVDVFIGHVHPEDRARVQGSLMYAASGLSSWASEFRVIWPDGSLHWLATRGSIYRSEEGKATRMLGTVVDITARKRAEGSLRASEELARGQVEILRRTQDVLALGSTPDQLAEHGLRVLTEQLDAHSCSVWRFDESTGFVEYEFGFEDGKLVTADDPRLGGFRMKAPMAEVWPMPDLFSSGKAGVLDDIRGMRSFPGHDRLISLGIVTVLVVPLFVSHRAEGMIGVRFNRRRALGDDEIELAQALAGQAMFAMRLTRSSEQGRAAAVIAERNRMARDIHDTLAQGFTGVIVQLQAAADATANGLPAEAGRHLQRAEALARDSLTEARRSVRALRPQELEDRDLSEALEVMIRKMTAGTPVSADFSLAGRPVKLPEDREENLLRVVQEVLTNALRHAQARHFVARIAFEGRELHIDLRDDGCGFEPRGRFDGFGLVGIRERVEAMQGTLTLQSAPGAGTAVHIALPLVADKRSAAT